MTIITTKEEILNIAKAKIGFGFIVTLTSKLIISKFESTLINLQNKYNNLSVVIIEDEYRITIKDELLIDLILVAGDIGTTMYKLSTYSKDTIKILKKHQIYK